MRPVAALAAIGIQPECRAKPALASIASARRCCTSMGRSRSPSSSTGARRCLHLVQMIRDESHRFAVTYHRKRREMRDRGQRAGHDCGVGPRTRQRLLEHFGSVRAIGQAGHDALTAVVSAATAARIREHFKGEADAG